MAVNMEGAGGSDLDSSRYVHRNTIASAGLAGANFGLATGGTYGSGCGVMDAGCSQELRLHGYTDFNGSGSRAYQHGSPR